MKKIMNKVKEEFLAKVGLSESEITAKVGSILQGSTDGDLFVEETQTQALSLENSKVKSTSFSESQGMGLRKINNTFCALLHSNILSAEKLDGFGKEMQSLNFDECVNKNLNEVLETPKKLYSSINPVDAHSLEERIEVLHKVDEYVRKQEKNVSQVMASITTNFQKVLIVRPEGIFADVRPLVRMGINVVLEKNGKMESGSFGFGGRFDDDLFFDVKRYESAADEAICQAGVLLGASHAPAGEMPIVLAAGWSGVLFHEAVGHGLEADFNRKGSSAFSGKIGQQVAAKGVTIVDDGTIENRRGSLTIDDEGTPTKRNVLIENGILKKYMQDRLNAREMGMELTGNGRRESYACAVLPRMTNTFLENGTDTFEEMLSGVQNGLFAKNFGGGQVDITSGNFMFEVTEGYLIENGKITKPVKGATLSGNGPNVLNFIDKIGSDLALDEGVGTCGKSGQSVPVGVGQPSLRIKSGVTVGGK